MDGMSKNPSHSSRLTHPCAPLTLFAVVQKAIESRPDFRPALTYHRSPRDWTQRHSPECVSRLGTTNWNEQTKGGQRCTVRASIRYQSAGPAIQANPSSIAVSASSALCKCGAFNQKVCVHPRMTSVLTSTPASLKILA